VAGEASTRRKNKIAPTKKKGEKTKQVVRDKKMTKKVGVLVATHNSSLHSLTHSLTHSPPLSLTLSTFTLLITPSLTHSSSA
jgi:hypothetical protein